MKKIILLLSVILVTSSSYSQEVNYSDTIVDGINSTWTNNDLDTLQVEAMDCLLYTSPSPRDRQKSRMPSSA